MANGRQHARERSPSSGVARWWSLFRLEAKRTESQTPGLPDSRLYDRCLILEGRTVS